MASKITHLIFPTIAAALVAGCGEQTPSVAEAPEQTPPLSTQAPAESLIAHQQFQLDNGLNVIFHVDRSDPVVAVALTSHVGSARELPGRTGFAHMFEHLLFLESENLGRGGLDQLSARIGGSGANGSTNRDRTNYFQTVPNDALEKMIWAEADKLGFFINTVTDAVLTKEKQVVMNEKRQRVDNRPYGHVNYVISTNLYPPDHPYHWQVIGSLEDLGAATLQDVKDFYRRWYVPNNVTLAIAGDFDVDQARAWVEKYFNEIPSGQRVQRSEKRPVQLAESKRFYYEDNFAQQPELRLTWPTVPAYHPDTWALNVLTEYLSEGKQAPLNEVLIDEKKLTSNVAMGSGFNELAGETTLLVRAVPGTHLDQVMAGFNEGFERFETNGITQRDLDRIKTMQEVAFYGRIGSVLGKAFSLAQYHIYVADPAFVDQDLANIQGVTREDVMRVYETYLKDQPFLATSFVPQGSAGSVLAGSTLAEVVEEQIVPGSEPEIDTSQVAEYERTPSTFDRTIEPPYGAPAIVKVPEIWESQLGNGLKVYGIENRELPLVQFELTIAGGQLLDDAEKVGVANLVAMLMNRGTANRTPAELEMAIEELGATINFAAGAETIVVRGSTLARNMTETAGLLGEMLLSPRWDEAEFELAKLNVDNQLTAMAADPNSIADRAFQRLVFGDEHIWSQDIRGTQSTLEELTTDDLKQYYAANISPTVSHVQIVGAIDQAAAMQALSAIDEGWRAREVTLPEYAAPEIPNTAQIYFHDVPGAKQSVFRFGYGALAETDLDYLPASAMNYILGGGGFASRFTQQLREGKGYTYNIRSTFAGSSRPGPFTIASSVRSNVTHESAALIRDILEQYADTYTEADLDVTQGFLLRSKARAFETLPAKLGLLNNISAYGWPHDYVEQEDEVIRNLTVERIRELARQYIRPDQMIYVIAGDAQTQLEGLEGLGLGGVVRLN